MFQRKYKPSQAARDKATALLNEPSPFHPADKVELITYMLENGWLEPLTPFEKLWQKVRNYFR